ncbi:response regulator [Paenibacillus sp. YIM B09110]|uniref:response regulator n=1 Tax=Paenibacillus sp. YIM B09110 TaxID=3126102 RepID=UPI00301B9194
MYKLILVDDEADVREGVLSEIDWEANGFQVIDVAENGREALEMVEKSMPDLIVTDIRMPFMDGLQLAEQIRRTYPSIKIIILTGFDEFEYARKAIHLNIQELVLKPFSVRDLLQALHKLKDILDAEMANRENVDSLQEHYRRSIPVLREQFLVSLMTRTLASPEIHDKTERYNMSLEGCYYAVAIMQLDNLAIEREAQDANRSRFDFELQSFAVRNIAEEILLRHEASGYVFQHNDSVVLLQISQGDHIDSVHTNSFRLLEDIRINVEKYIRRSITIGLGRAKPQLSAIKYAYTDAVTALDYRILLGNNRIIAIEDVESRANVPIHFDELQEQAFLRCLKVGTTEEMESIVDNLFAPLVTAGALCSYQDAQIFLLQIVTAMLKSSQEPVREPSERPANNSDWVKEITQVSSILEAKSWVISTCAAIMSRIANDRLTAYHSLVEQACAYTKAHFADSEISIAKLCAHLHISSGYFSSIFKREKKMTFVNYLLHIRMEAAKEMLLTTDKKAFEIAELVGYADPNYFSFSFKKQVGMSPKDYRNRTRGDSS